MATINRFEDLDVWIKSRKLCNEIQILIKKNGSSSKVVELKANSVIARATSNFKFRKNLSARSNPVNNSNLINKRDCFRQIGFMV